jgi:hypothetical protein
VCAYALQLLTFVDRRRSRTDLGREAATPATRAVVEKPFGFEPIRRRNASRLTSTGSFMIGRAAVQVTSMPAAWIVPISAFLFRLQVKRKPTIGFRSLCDIFLLNSRPSKSRWRFDRRAAPAQGIGRTAHSIRSAISTAALHFRPQISCRSFGVEWGNRQADRTCRRARVGPGRSPADGCGRKPIVTVFARKSCGVCRRNSPESQRERPPPRSMRLLNRSLAASSAQALSGIAYN